MQLTILAMGHSQIGIPGPNFSNIKFFPCLILTCEFIFSIQSNLLHLSFWTHIQTFVSVKLLQNQ